jgi:hypothetical protein
MKIARRGCQVFIDTEATNLAGYRAFEDATERQFRITPFKTLAGSPTALWARVFRPINLFLKNLPESDVLRLGHFYINLHRQLGGTDGIGDAGRVVAAAFRHTMDGIDLPARLLHFVIHDSGMVLPAHVMFAEDSLIMTRDEYSRFIVIGLLTKLCFPLWGEMLTHAEVGLSDGAGLVACHDVLTTFLDDKPEFQPVIEKFRGYTKTIVDAIPPEHWCSDETTSKQRFDREVRATLIVGHYPEVSLDVLGNSAWLAPQSRLVADALLARHIVHRHDADLG